MARGVTAGLQPFSTLMDHSLEDEFDPTHFPFFHLFPFSHQHFFCSNISMGKMDRAITMRRFTTFLEDDLFFFNHPFLYLRTFFTTYFKTLQTNQFFLLCCDDLRFDLALIVLFLHLRTSNFLLARKAVANKCPELTNSQNALRQSIFEIPDALCAPFYPVPFSIACTSADLSL